MYPNFKLCTYYLYSAIFIKNFYQFYCGIHGKNGHHVAAVHRKINSLPIFQGWPQIPNPSCIREYSEVKKKYEFCKRLYIPLSVYYIQINRDER